MKYLTTAILALFAAAVLAGPPSPNTQPERQYLSWVDAYIQMDVGYCVRREGWGYPRSRGCVFKIPGDDHMRWWLPTIRNGHYPAWGFWLPDMTDDWYIVGGET